MDKQAEVDKMVVIGCCSTGSASGGHRAGTPPLLEPALQQSIKTILFVSAYLSASAASLVQGRWIYHKSTGPIGEWGTPTVRTTLGLVREDFHLPNVDFLCLFFFRSGLIFLILVTKKEKNKTSQNI